MRISTMNDAGFGRVRDQKRIEACIITLRGGKKEMDLSLVRGLLRALLPGTSRDLHDRR